MTESSALDRRVYERAKGLCEYCRLPQSAYPLPFQVDHIIAGQHRGKTQLSNLALACPPCNRSKGPNIAGIDIRTKEITALYHPRRDRWEEHFRWRGPRLVGLTAIGRVTIQVLGLNQSELVKMRRALIAEGVFAFRGEEDQEPFFTPVSLMMPRSDESRLPRLCPGDPRTGSDPDLPIMSPGG
jgi:hypothetical protein